MLTNLTVGTSIGAAPDIVLSFVADPRNLPRWAPTFAQHVRRDGDHWLVESNGGQVLLHVRVSFGLGTVDFLAADAPRDRPVGAYSRVVRNNGGSEYLFTRFLAPELSDEEFARERTVLLRELAIVREWCERKETDPGRVSEGSGPAPPSRRPTPCRSPSHPPR